MKRAVLLSGCLVALTTSCGRRATSPGPVDVVHDPEMAPEWAVRYGREFWRIPGTTGAEIDVGRVIDRVSHAIERDDRGVPRVASRRYDASFDGTGVRFSPRAEAAAPATVLRTASVHRGGTRLDDRGGVPWSITGNTAQARLRADGALVAHHEARGGGVEIAWVLDRAPEGDGPVTIELALSGLRWERHSAGGHHFVDASGAPFVRVSDAIAIDAAGARWPLTSTPAGTGLRIEVPDAVIDAAVYPLAIDPVVSPDIVVGDLHYVPDDATQSSTEIAFGAGVWLVAWRDQTFENSTNYDLTATRVGTDGIALDPQGLDIASQVNSQTVGGIAFDGTNFLVVWDDNRVSTNVDVYGRRVRASDGALLDATDGVLLVGESGTQAGSRAAFDGTNFVVVWHDMRDGGFDVYAARVDPADLSVADGAGVPVAADPAYQESSPDIAFDGANYLVVWDDHRNAATLETDVFGARLQPDMVVLDTAGFAVSSETGDQSFPALLFDGTNHFAVWEDQRNGSTNRDVFGARIEPDGSVVDTNGLGIATATRNQRFPKTAFDGTNYGVVYQHDGSFEDEIQMVRVDAATGAIVDATPATLAAATTSLQTPAVSSDGATWLVAWSEFRDPSELDVVATRLSLATLSALEAPSILSTQPGAEAAPAVASDGTSHLIVFEHLDGNQTDIYGARVRASDGVVLDLTPILVSTEEDSQAAPAIAFDGTRYFVVWEDDRIPGSDVFGVPVERDGTVGTEVEVNAEAGGQTDPAVAVSGTTLLIAWTDNRNGNSDVYAARVRTTDHAVLDATALPIAAPGTVTAQFRADVAGDGSGFLVVWDDRRNDAQGDIWGARVDAGGGIVTPDIVVGGGAWQQVEPAVAFDGTSYLVVWRDQQGATTDIWGNRVRASDGAVLDGASGVGLFEDGTSQLEIDVAFAETGYLLAWRNDAVHGARLRASDLTLLDPSGFEISATSRVERAPAVSWGGGRFLVAYDSFDSADQSAYVRARLIPESEPDALDDAAATDEDVALSVPAPGVLSNDTDPTDDPLTAILLTDPASGSVTLGADGAYLYTPDPDFNGVDSFTYAASDGIAQSLPATVTLTVGSVNDAPSAAADAVAVDEDGTLAVDAPGVLTNDGDVDGDALRALLDASSANGTLTLATDGSFVYTPDPDFAGGDAFSYHANDGIADSAVTSVAITVSPVNDAPVISAPASVTVDEDATLSLVDADLVSVSDADAAGADVAVSLAVGLGTLSLADTTGLTFSAGDGADDMVLAFTGTLSAVNAALGSLSYAPPQDEDGDDSLAVGVDDQGNTGASGALTDAATIPIAIAPANDAPANTVPGAQSVEEDTDLVLSASVADVEPGELEVTLSSQQGALTLATAGGLTFTSGDGIADTTVVFRGTASAINAALDGLRYRASADYHGADTVSLSTDDLGNGGGTALVDEDSFAVTVSPVNDAPSAPVALSPAGGEVIDERSPVLTVTNGTDVDDASLTYDFEVRAGATVVASVSGVPGGASSTSWTVDPPLERGEAYTWTATAVDAAGASATSGEAAFEVEPGRKKASSCACDLSGDTSSPGAAPFATLVAVAGMFLSRRRRAAWAMRLRA